MNPKKRGKTDLITMLVEHYRLSITSEEMTNVENPLTILKRKLSNTEKNSMLNKIIPVVFLVGKATKDMEDANLINTDVQDLMVQYSKDLSCNKIESSVKPKFATLGEFFSFFGEEMEMFHAQCTSDDPYFAYGHRYEPKL